MAVGHAGGDGRLRFPIAVGTPVARRPPRTDPRVRLSHAVEAPGIVFVLETGDHVIGIAHDDHVPSGMAELARLRGQGSTTWRDPARASLKRHIWRRFALDAIQHSLESRRSNRDDRRHESNKSR